MSSGVPILTLNNGVKIPAIGAACSDEPLMLANYQVAF